MPTLSLVTLTAAGLCFPKCWTRAASGLPPGAVKFKALLAAHDGLLVASPEYNGSVTAVLKNAIDWATRGEGNSMAGRTAALLAASPGPRGGLRGLDD